MPDHTIWIQSVLGAAQHDQGNLVKLNRLLTSAAPSRSGLRENLVRFWLELPHRGRDGLEYPKQQQDSRDGATTLLAPAKFADQSEFAMRVLLVNPPHPAVSSRCHKGQMPPLGLLAVGGPLIDAGHTVKMIDADVRPLSIAEIISIATAWQPDVVLLGHSGSTSAHPVIVEIAREIKATMPKVRTVYGGVFPTYHAAEVLREHPEIDFIVRGEGEATTRTLLAAVESGATGKQVPGVAYRDGDVPQLTPPAAPIRDLNAFRVGWELIEDWNRYQYWGAGRAAVVQFSRGCPHLCTYCGQRGFWTQWRYRDPHRVAAEIGWLHREHGVAFVDLADENPTTSRRLWKSFLESLIAENVPVQIIATIRSADIVRDADILNLYKQAGFSRILMGVETVNDDTLVKIRKGTTTTIDREAIRLLREHDILSQVAYVVGFEEERDRDYFHGLRQLLSYDPDQISWRVFLWLKLTEAILQLRPRALGRVMAHRDNGIRKSLRWCYTVGGRAWLFEVRSFFQRGCDLGVGMTLERFWGAGNDIDEEAHANVGVLDRAMVAEPRET
jgi:anaerobic magnesium-protoporphyrin IX monomethyl ester cyclase